MQKNVAFQIEEAVEVPNWADAYPQHKFSVFKACFLSTRENSHKIPITEDVLRKSAPSILGSFLVAKIDWGDATTHKSDEIIYGYAPMNQEIEFIEEDDILKAYCYFVVSKRYSEEFNGIFEFDNLRNSSVEMTVEYENEECETVIGLDIFGLTCLGKRVNGSCPDADIKMVRFSQKKAEDYFSKNDAASNLKQFVAERKEQMAEKTYKVDKSKEALSDTPWGDVDKTSMRNKIMEASNKSSLVKDVYMLVEDGWEDAPSEKLKYPVMQLKGDTFAYNRDGLASALGYAKKENESTVINKVEAIYKKLGLEQSDGKEEDAKMEMEELEQKETEIEMAESEETKEEEMAEAQEEEMSESEPCEEKEEEMSEPCEEEQEEEAKMSEDEMMAKISELEQCIEEKENIIMTCNKELEELRQFKADIEEKEKAMAVESIMSEVKEFLDEAQFAELRTEGLSCAKEELDAFANKAKAMCFSAVKKQPKKKETNGVFSFAAPIENNVKKESTSVWDRI